LSSHPHPHPPAHLPSLRNRRIYQNGDAFNDVTTGCNKANGREGFTATKGWDAATGWGTPNAGKLLTRI
jgi:tripeptidyl-peptidase-1